MLKRMKKISLAACALFAATAMVGGIFAMPVPQSVSAETTAKYVSTDVVTGSAWETAGYGEDGYLIFGVKNGDTVKAYSDMYGNDGKTELSLFRDGSGNLFYDNTGTSTDSTAPISGVLVNGSANWTTCSSSFSYLYVPDTETHYPMRLYNNMNGLYDDLGVGFKLRETEKIRVSTYVLDYRNKVSESNPITVGLYKEINKWTTCGYSSTTNVRTMEENYGTALAETTVTSQGAYVTFEIEGAGDYQIVAYYDNEGTEEPPVTPMIMGLFFDVQSSGGGGSSEPKPVGTVSVDVETKSAWETAGYGEDGYLIMGANASNKAAAYSNMYTEQGNDGKTEIAMNKSSANSWHYDAACTKSFDSTAPISKLVLNGSSIWQNGNQSKTSYLYVPGTQTTYPGRIHNNMASVYRDFGIGFTLRTTKRTDVTVYISDWEGKASETLPITVGLYRGIKTGTVQGYSDSPIVQDKTIEQHYGTALAETTVTTCAGAYVTFTIEGAGDYQIVAYYDNQDPTTNSAIIPMFTGLFFDVYGNEGGNEGGEEGGNEGGEEGGNTQPPVLLPIPAIATIDTETKSAWETAGYGKDGYFIFGRNQDGGYATYSDLYTEQGKDGKTEISLYRHGDNTYYYSYDQEAKKGITVDETAIISNLIINGSSQWKAPGDAVNAANQLYIPGTQTTYPLDLFNNVLGLYNDLGVGFTLRPAAKTYVTVYVMDRMGQVSESAPITVALYNKIQTTTVFGYGNNKSKTVDEHYGAALAKVAVTENGTYVTFEIDGGGDYQIVAYYDNQGASNAPVHPMMTGLFFERETGTLANLTYNVDGGENGPNPKTYVVGKGAKLSDPFKEDYTFDGWFTDSEYTNQVTEISTEQTGDLTLYAKFTRKHLEFTISYVTNGGEHSNTPTSYVWGVGATLTDATKAGYTFVGWYYDNEDFLERALEIAPEQKGNVTLYARFVKNPTVSNITYEADSGVHTNPATYTEGEAFSLVAAAKEGYIFLGWYTDSECTNEITEISAEQTGDITLYAKFAKLPQSFAITYVVDGGTHYNPASYTEGTAVVLSDAIKAGYTIEGWYTESECTNKITEISATQTGDITLYAKFTEIVVPDNSDSSNSGSNSGSSSGSGASQQNGGCSGTLSIGIGVIGVMFAVGAMLAKKKED